MLEKTTLQVQKDLLVKFQNAVSRRFGKLKGAQSEALAEAMKLWLSYVGEEMYFSVEGSLMSLDEAVNFIVEKVKDGSLHRSDVTLIPLAFSLHEDSINRIRGAFEKVFGKAINEGGEDRMYLKWNIDENRELVMYFWTYFVGVGLREKNIAGFKELS